MASGGHKTEERLAWADNDHLGQAPPAQEDIDRDYQRRPEEQGGDRSLQTQVCHRLQINLTAVLGGKNYAIMEGGD